MEMLLVQPGVIREEQLPGQIHHIIRDNQDLQKSITIIIEQFLHQLKLQLEAV